ncbi:MAG: sulfurtransferase TusA family protein [Acidilobaceae archaeon]|nr:sulfurtransferase TusA family protein [Acidilobaceae archaeon]MCX8165230.1 sulfurtransferase TusA family protein [Acidilobaceae archaeon]MDW7973656.1 sulfurtransferase TusA family protein [Sulfolobales archaeon]
MVTLDMRGKRCPEPFVEIVRAFMGMGWKGEVKVIMDSKDCAEFVKSYGEDLGFQVSYEAKGDHFELTVRRGGS